MRHRTTPLTAWLLGGIASCLLVVDVLQLLFSAESRNVFGLLMGSLTLAAGAALSVSADSRWSE